MEAEENWEGMMTPKRGCQQVGHSLKDSREVV